MRLAGDDRALYETFFRSFPHDAVTKARFVSVMRTLFGVDEGKQAATQEQLDLCRHLERMHSVFELSDAKVPMLQWRTFLSSLRLVPCFQRRLRRVYQLTLLLLLLVNRMLQEPLLTLREHLRWTFSVFSSTTYLELSNSSAIKAVELAQLFTHFLQSPTASRFVCDRVCVP